jgi:hypothetical protein
MDSQKVISKKKIIKNLLFVGILEIPDERAGSGFGVGSIFGCVQVYRSKDPEPYQIVTDPEHWFVCYHCDRLL